MVLVVFDLILKFVNSFALTSYFLLSFFVSLKKIPRPKSFWPVFYRPNDIILIKFLTFLEKYPPNSEILCAIEITGRVNPFFISGFALFNHTNF